MQTTMKSEGDGQGTIPRAERARALIDCLRIALDFGPRAAERALDQALDRLEGGAGTIGALRPPA
ncbi:MAG: hypothetical protein AB7Q97_02520 [Gammaproteobacteria bacterium]